MRGAAPVNDEFEVGYDQRFEARWWTAALIGRVVMAVFVLVALAGLLGRGPLSHARAASPDGGLAVDYEPVARFATPTLVTLYVRNEDAAPREVAIFLAGEIAEPMGFQRAVPRSEATLVEQSGMTLRFSVAARQDAARIRLQLQPTQVGPIRLRADAGSGARVGWTQFVMP